MMIVRCARRSTRAIVEEWPPKLKRLTPRERLEQLVLDVTPLLRAAFMEAIDDSRSNIVRRHVVERLERGNIIRRFSLQHLPTRASANKDEQFRFLLMPEQEIP